MNVLFKLLQSAKRLDPGGFTLYKIFTEIEMDLPTKSPWPLCIEIIQLLIDCEFNLETNKRDFLLRYKKAVHDVVRPHVLLNSMIVIESLIETTGLDIQHLDPDNFFDEKDYLSGERFKRLWRMVL